MTVKERVFLHLFAFQRYGQDADAPKAVTQDGIAQATSVGRNNVTKIVTELTGQSLVEVQSKHVKGMPSVRKVYFLTQKGFQEALALKRDIESTRIVIIEIGGRRVEDEVGKLSLYLPKQYPFLELAMGVQRGEFDCQSFHEGKIKEDRRGVDYGKSKPTIRSFYGRGAELQRISQFIQSDAKVLIVQGIAGIGKTTLVAKFSKENADQFNNFWFPLHDWVDVKGLLRPLGEFLSQVGRKALEYYLTQTDTVSISEVTHVMETDLKEASAVWILDDVQKAGKGVADLLSAFVVLLESLPNIKMICTSREVPTFYTRSQVISGVVQELVLEGLDWQSSSQLMRERAVSDAYMAELFRVTKGHPLFMELVEDPKEALGKSIRMFVEQEVYSKLEVAEKRILEIASVFRYPVPTDAFFIMDEQTTVDNLPAGREREYRDYMVDYDTIDALVRKSLLLESSGRTLGMHDVIREFFYSRLAPRQRVLFHRAASSYYLMDGSAPSNVEALYHGLQANDCAPSVRIAAGNGRDIISKGYSNLLSPLLDGLLMKCPAIETSDRMEVLLLQAEVRDVQGEWDQAMRRYEEIASLASPEKDRRLMAEVRRRIGVIYLRRYAYHEALDHLYQAKSLAGSLGDAHTLSLVLYDIGGVLERSGKPVEALAMFQESERLAAQIGEDASHGKALHGIGRAYAQRREMQKAIAFKRAALEVLERSGDANEVAKVCASLGGDLLNEGLKEEAISILERAVERANSVGNLNTLVYALANLAAAQIEIGIVDKVETVIDQAFAIANKLNERYILATLHLYRGYVYHKRREWEWAKESYGTALKGMRSINSPTRLSHWLYEIAKVYVENGDLEEAHALLDESLGISISAEQVDLVRQVQELMVEIDLRRGG